MCGNCRRKLPVNGWDRIRPDRQTLLILTSEIKGGQLGITLYVAAHHDFIIFPSVTFSSHSLDEVPKWENGAGSGLISLDSIIDPSLSDMRRLQCHLTFRSSTAFIHRKSSSSPCEGDCAPMRALRSDVERIGCDICREGIRPSPRPSRILRVPIPRANLSAAQPDPPSSVGG